jgi:organic radical activating enzyme
MKSLQLVVPFQTCPFQCPFCIANNPEVENAFVDLYSSNPQTYFRLLGNVLRDSPELRTVVITGDTEPTLNMQWIKDVVEFVKNCNPNIQVELQTKNFNKVTVATLLHKTEIDVYGFSVDTVRQANQVSEMPFKYYTVPFRKKRLTVLLNSRFDITKFEPHYTVDQITFKKLQLGNNEKINDWIINHQFINSYGLERFIETYKKSVSIMLDENCMKSIDRYQIFRSDGFLYKTWTDLPK